MDFYLLLNEHYISIEITTVEGVLQKTRQALFNDQKMRERCDPINAEKIDKFICKLDELMQLKRRFTLVSAFNRFDCSFVL